MSKGVVSDTTRFPADAYSKVDLSNTAQTVSSSKVAIVWGVVVGGAAAEVLQFQDAAGTVLHSLNVPIGAVIPLGPLFFRDGLKVATADAAGDVSIFLAISK